MMPAMKILITGSAGRVGRAIYVRLQRNHEVIGFDTTPASVVDVVADITNKDALIKALKGVDAVVHTAALHAPHVPHVRESRFVEVNVDGTRNVIEACLECGVRKIAFTSTTALYGDASTPVDAAGWVTEDTVPVPRTIYHRTKLAAESLLREAAEETGKLQVTALRMSRCFPEPVDLMACYRLHRGVDARDVASAHELALESSDRPYRQFVISGGTPFLQEDAAILKSDAAAVLRMRAPDLVSAFNQRGWRFPQSIDRVYVSELAQQELEWKPRHDFREVLRQHDDESAEVLRPQT